MSAPSLLTLTHLRRTYQGAGGVRDVSLHVPRGAIYVLAGANGSGKTTTLSVLAGLLFAESGTLTLDAAPIPIDRHARRPGLGYVPDQPILDPYLTAWQWAAFTSALQQAVWDPAAAQAVATALHLTPETLAARLETLSFGTRRKVALWMAFVTTPRLLVLDEPLVGLDPDAIEGFHATAQAFVASGRSVIYSTHLLREAEALATHVGVLRHGGLAAEGTLAEIRGSGSLADAFRQMTVEGTAPEATAVVPA